MSYTQTYCVCPCTIVIWSYPNSILKTLFLEFFFYKKITAWQYKAAQLFSSMDGQTNKHCYDMKLKTDRYFSNIYFQNFIPRIFVSQEKS